MKKSIRPYTEEQILKRFPIKDRLEDWYFRIDEVSNNVYEIQGSDLYGRLVSKKGTNPEVLLDECIEDAKKIKSHVLTNKG
jgi:hypothetical protein